MPKPRVNDPCPCGSGRKYKHCHGSPRTGAHEPLRADDVAAARAALGAGRPAEAQRLYLTRLDAAPNDVDALLGMATLAERAGDAEASAHYHLRVAEIGPPHPHAQLALGNFYAKRYDFARSRERYRYALELSPSLPGAWNNLGNVEKYLGHFKEAIACYDRALAADPGNATLEHNALLTLPYDASIAHDEIFARHVAWAKRHAARFYPRGRTWRNVRDPERRLNVGYVSAGFDGRIVGHFLRNVLPHHDRDRFATFGYSNTREPDEHTAFLRTTFDHWREIRALDDDAVARQVEADAIDILVDVDGHAPDSRLLVFARKAAPVQASWLDYFDTTGVETIDYVVTDPYTTPADSPQRFVETPLRLPETRLCYAPAPYAPDVAPLPRERRDAFTFGSFNRYDKLVPDVVDRWAEILRRVPASRLVLKNSANAIAPVRAEIVRRFGERGVAAGRIELRARTPHAAMLAEYGDIDLALDPFPYNGGLTTCEALWMGVPIVALEGERMISRQTAAMLRLVGAAGFVGRTHGEYVALAVRWAADIAGLASMRASLRERMRASPLCDGPRFTRDLEAAWRRIWIEYCGRGP